MTGSMLYAKRSSLPSMCAYLLPCRGLYDIISTKDYVRIYKLFMQNKANFVRFSSENADFTKKQTQFKPNLSQFKPNLSQFKANLTRNKPNQSQFGEGPKRAPISNDGLAQEWEEIQITFDLAIGISIKSYVTQKSSVATEIMRKG